MNQKTIVLHLDADELRTLNGAISGEIGRRKKIASDLRIWGAPDSESLDKGVLYLRALLLKLERARITKEIP